MAWLRVKRTKGRAMRRDWRLRQLEAHWEALRPSGDIPNRLAINPNGISDLLEFAFTLERRSDGKAVFRLSPDRLGDLLGTPLRGIPVDSLFASDLRDQVRRDLARVFDSPALLKAQLQAAPSIMGGAIDAELLVMPLRGMNGIDRAIGALVYDAPLGKAPRLFSSFSSVITLLQVTHSFQTESETQLQGMQEAPTAFRPKEKRPTCAGRPELTVIKGGLD